ncbi:MAG: hypothetical protein COY40_05730 [Alphaproteobacteria bacterium CG_4_10_14_0_8_um_filter_53_9]|nr:MAG: hypothetical protein COY40_05730 [Alphaproteobacteria bacterium CG_4_10_14_0_8_um_filter_53_9]
MLFIRPHFSALFVGDLLAYIKTCVIAWAMVVFVLLALLATGLSLAVPMECAAGLPSLFAFSAVNGLVFASLAFVVVRMVRGPEAPVGFAWPVAVAALLLLSLPDASIRLFFAPEALARFWPVLPFLLFLMPYRWLTGGKDVISPYGPLGMMLWVLLAAGAGAWLPVAASTVSALTLLFMADALWQQRRTGRTSLPPWGMVGMLALLAGALFSPVKPLGNSLPSSLLTALPLLIPMALFMALWVPRGLRDTLTTNIPARHTLLWLLGALMSLLISPAAFALGWVFLMMATLTAVHEIAPLYPRLAKGGWSFLVAASVILILQAAPVALLAQSQHRLHMAELAACTETPTRTCLLSPYRLPEVPLYPLPRVGQISVEALDDANICRAEAYGLQAVRARF